MLRSCTPTPCAKPVVLYSHLVFLFLYASFSISKVSDQDLLEQIKIGKKNLAKAIMTGDKDLIEKVGLKNSRNNPLQTYKND